MQLQDLGEFGLIEKIKQLVGQPSAEVLVGIDDDAAALALSDEDVLLLTTDALVEGVHFDLAYVSFENLGWKALTVNLSDIAAMGGVPQFALVTFSAPATAAVSNVEAFYQGLTRLGERFNVTIIGGDTARSPDALMISLTVIGKTTRARLIKRSGARPGDQVFVTGDLGRSHAGLQVLRKQDRKLSAQQRESVQKHLEPLPRVHAARFLVEHARPNAMIDLSDGLVSDLGHICKQSGVGAIIDTERLPIAASTIAIAQHFKETAIDYALSGGEDYELLFTAPAGSLDIDYFEKRLGIPCTHIGLISDGHPDPEIRFEGSGDRSAAVGFDHFAV